MFELSHGNEDTPEVTRAASRIRPARTKTANLRSQQQHDPRLERTQAHTRRPILWLSASLVLPGRGLCGHAAARPLGACDSPAPRSVARSMFLFPFLFVCSFEQSPLLPSRCFR